MGKLERLAPALLGVAVFLAVAGVALVPTVRDTDRSTAIARIAPSTPDVIRQIEASVATTPTTTDPKLDPTPTVPPPDDLGSVIVDFSDLGFRRLQDPKFDAAFDLATLPGTASASRSDRLTREGFTRGYTRAVRIPDGVVLSIDVYEFQTGAGAADEQQHERDSATHDPAVSSANVSEPFDSVGYRIESTQGGTTYHELVITTARAARYYVIDLFSPDEVPDIDLGSQIATRQADAP